MKKHVRLSSILVVVLVSVFVLFTAAFSASASEDYDYTMTTDGSMSIAHTASYDFYYTIEDTSIATVSDTITNSMSSMVGPWGSSISISKSATITPVKPGETKILARTNFGIIIGEYSLLVKEGKHQMVTKEVIKQATADESGKQVQKCKFCSHEKTVTVPKIASIKLDTETYTYNGKVKTPGVIIKDAKGNVLKKDTDYTVKYAKGRKNAGKYEVTVEFKGKYSGTETLTFTIKPIDVSQCTIKLGTKSFTYDGKVKTTKVRVKSSSGKTLLKGTHYTVTYAKGRKNVGTYKVTVTMKGNYTGTKVLTFKIVPPKTAIKKITPDDDALKISVDKETKQVTGYEVQYSTSKKFKKATTQTIKSYKKTSTVLKSLKSNTKYFVRVRTYKTIKGTTYYSGWSSYKTARTK